MNRIVEKMKRVAGQSTIDKKFVDKNGNPDYELILEYVYDDGQIEVDHNSHTQESNPGLENPGYKASNEVGFTVTYDLNNGKFKELTDSERQQLVKAINEHPHSKEMTSNIIKDLTEDKHEDFGHDGIDADSNNVNVKANLSGSIITIEVGYVG